MSGAVEAPESGTYSETTLKAGKDHRCYECRRKIAKGTHHWLIKGLWDGQWQEFRFCVRCVRIRDMAYAKYGDFSDEVAFGQLKEFIWESGVIETLRACRRRWHEKGIPHREVMTGWGSLEKDPCFITTLRSR